MKKEKFRVSIKRGSGLLRESFRRENIHAYYDFRNDEVGEVIVHDYFLEAVANKDVMRIEQMGHRVEEQKNLIKLLNTLEYMDKLGYVKVSNEEYEENMRVQIENNKIIIFLYNNLKRIYGNKKIQDFLKNLDKIEVPQKITFE